MNWLHALIPGILQQLARLLPVSSSKYANFGNTLTVANKVRVVFYHTLFVTGLLLIINPFGKINIGITGFWQALNKSMFKTIAVIYGKCRSVTYMVIGVRIGSIAVIYNLL